MVMAGPLAQWLDDTFAADCMNGIMKMVWQMHVTKWLTGWLAGGCVKHGCVHVKRFR